MNYQDHATHSPAVSEIPEFLKGIYTSCGSWEAYDTKAGYRKQPCMIRVGGTVFGPCWPNAGKFRSLNGSDAWWWEEVVDDVAYFGAESQKPAGNSVLNKQGSVNA